MRILTSIAVVLVLVSSGVGGGIAIAQSDTPTPTDTDTPAEQANTTTTDTTTVTPTATQTQTPTATPTRTPTDTPEPTETPTATPTETDDTSLNISSDDLWEVFRNSQEKTNANNKEIIATLSNSAWVTGFTLNEQEETARITITQKTTSSYTFSDSNSADRGSKVSYIDHRTETIPRGTYTIVVPATVAPDGNQQVCITGSTDWPCLSNGDTDGGNNWLDKSTTVGVAIAGIVAFLIGIVVRIGWKVYREQETGSPESMDGTEITASRVGVEDDE